MGKSQLEEFRKSQEEYVVEQPNAKFALKEEWQIEEKIVPHLSNNTTLQKYLPIVSLLLAISVTVFLGVFLCVEISRLNDDMFGSITIQGEPELLNALKGAQNKGVIIAIHGWEHENYSSITPFQARENVERAKLVFERAGLVPRVFISPFEISGIPTNTSVRQAIESTEIPTQLTPLKISGDGIEVNEYTWNWRTMESFDDPRYHIASETIRRENPQTIVLHAIDWNPYVMQFLVDYLSTTNQTNITVRVDDVEVNTPKKTVNEMTTLAQYKSVGRVIFAVIPVGMWRGGNPTIDGLEVNNIMKMYFWFFILTSLLPLSFFVLWKSLSAWDTKKNQKENQPPKNLDVENPELVSIIAPAYNEEKTIGKCLEAILNQDYKDKMEIIVVNDGSTDQTAEIVSKYPVNLVNLRINGGKANALNRAIENAKGDILIFTDSDSYMSASAVTCLVKCLNKNKNVQMVAGNVFINNGRKKRIMHYFQMIEYLIEQEITRYLQGLNGHVVVCPGPLTAVRHEVCDTIRFSDETVVEDADFTIKVLKSSMKIIREPKAEVYTNAPETFRAWYKQRKRWWYGNLQVWRLHKQWAIRDPWMVLNYSGYIIGICSVILAISMPYFILQYDNTLLAFLRGLVYIVIPVLLFMTFITPLFAKEKKLLIMLIPYVLFYLTIKVVMMSYFYLCYLIGKGVKIQFGSRIIKAK